MRKTCVLVLAAALMAGSARAQSAAPASSSLKIVIVQGEDAVNIIQQKTAVAPVIEVRDRNNLPVAGASVTFSVGGQGASFAGGAQSLTVVTNAAGQATAAGLTPTAAGAINISATATFQGETAIATIAQSNVLTAAGAAGTTAATGSAGGGSGSSAGGGAAGGGGGLSGTTLGIVGAVAGTGALVAAKAAGGGSDSPAATSGAPTSTTAGSPTQTAAPTSTSPPATSPPAPAPTSASSYSGPMDGTFNGTSTVTYSDGFPAENCSFALRQTGTATMRVQSTLGTGNGTLELSGRQRVSTASCGAVAGLLDDQPFTWTANVDVSGNNVRFTQEFRDSGSVTGATYSTVTTLTFTGTISSSGLSGTLTYNASSDVRGDGFSVKAQYTGTMPINLAVR